MESAWILRLAAYDQRLSRVVNRCRRGVRDRVMRGLTRLGSPVPSILLAMGLAAGLLPVPGPGSTGGRP